MTWYLKAKEPEYDINHIWMFDSKIKALKEMHNLIAFDWREIQYPSEE